MKSCFGCGATVPASKSLCDRCFSKAANEREGINQHLESLVKRVVRESLQEREANKPYEPPPEPLGFPSGEGQVHETWESSQPSHPGMGFEYTLVPSLVRAVKDALNWEDPITSPPKQRKCFKQFNKERQFFLFLTEVGGSNEWGKTDRKSSMQSKMQKLYPFKEEEVKHLESAPLVDAALLRLVRYVTLPLDPLERRIDSDLIYLTSGMACKPVLALAQSLKPWNHGWTAWTSPPEAFPVKWPKTCLFKRSGWHPPFWGGASIDVIRLVSRGYVGSRHSPSCLMAPSLFGGLGF